MKEYLVVGRDRLNRGSDRDRAQIRERRDVCGGGESEAAGERKGDVGRRNDQWRESSIRQVHRWS